VSFLENHGMLLAYYGDDFTGSTDVMEALSVNGVGTVLFLEQPDEAALGRAAIMAARLDQKQRAIEYAQSAVTNGVDGYTGLYNAACAYSVMGDRDGAIALLERAVKNASGNLAWIEGDSDLDNLRGDPRFQAIIERMRASSG